MEQQIGIRLDAEDAALLAAVVRFEKLSRSDIFRRALRQYARAVGIEQPKPRKHTKR
jgi:hypothetical protein